MLVISCGNTTVVDNQCPPILLYFGRMAHENCLIFAGLSSVLKKELIAHFSVFLANCLRVSQIFEGKKKCKY
jgi:hypothetical protein